MRPVQKRRFERRRNQIKTDHLCGSVSRTTWPETRPRERDDLPRDDLPPLVAFHLRPLRALLATAHQGPQTVSLDPSRGPLARFRRTESAQATGDSLRQSVASKV